MKKSKKAFIVSLIAFFVGSSCCWLTALSAWLGGAAIFGLIVSYIESVQTIILAFGVILLIIALFVFVINKQ